MKPPSIITDAVVARAAPRKREYALRDARLPGLALRVQPSGAKSWTLRLRRDGETRRITLGAADVMSADEARARAHALLATEAADPTTAALARAAPPGITFAVLADAFVAAKEGSLRPSSLAKLRVYLRTQLLPAFGPRSANRLTTMEVAAWFHGYARSRPGGANVALSHLRTILLWGQSVGWLEADWADPTKPIRRNRRPPRGALLTAAQLGALGAALDRARREDADAADAVRLILLTGCRSGEILQLAWADVQGDRLHLPRTKTVPRDVLLSAAARAALDQRSASAKTALVFPGGREPLHPAGGRSRAPRQAALAKPLTGRARSA